MSCWILYLDDVRDPPPNPFSEGTALAELPWHVARSSEEALAMVRSMGFPVYMSLDHDLGGDDTTMVFLSVLSTPAYWDGKTAPPSVRVHSSNPVGRDNIVSFMRSWGAAAD